MAIVARFDVHRRQITFDALDTSSGEVSRGRIDATPAAVARWIERFDAREIDVAVEACTGWLFVCDALVAAGAVAHLAEPVETRALRGRKRRAKTDREDARWLRELLAEGRLPEAWIPPEHVRQWRSRARLRHTLIDERTQWFQRIRATLFHHGVSGTPEKLRTGAGRAFLEALELPDDARERIEIALAMVDAIDAQIAPLERELRALARRQTGCRVLMRLYGMGELTALVTLCELGDVQRLSASRKAVRMAGIDIGVHRSDRRSRVGKLNRQGSPHLRWALYEPALAVFACSLGYAVSFDATPAGVGGWCDRKTKRIVVDADAPANAQLRTLIHETAHALGVDYQCFSRGQAEVIVDTVTFIVCAGVGLAVDGETIPYVAGWGEDGDLDAVSQFADTIDRLARRIENALQPPDRPEPANRAAR
jgi:transposase